MRWLVFLSVSCLYAASPIISNVKVTMDTNAGVVSYNVAPDSYCWVQYGVTSGSYLWSSVSITSATGSGGWCSIPINGLKDGTTYWFLPTARPNPDDEMNVCNVSSCGAVEQSATTPAASVSHAPAPPGPMAENILSEPDTTGYAIVTLADGGAGVNHECVASANVTAPAGYNGTITAGQTLSAILAAAGTELWYGTVFQVPQGLTCIVKSINPPNGAGYQLPVLPIDPNASGGLVTALNHRWIILRTSPGAPADFPPFGVRTGPSFFGHYGGFQAAQPPTLPGVYNAGEIFTTPCGGGMPHHYWIENLEFQVDAAQNSHYGPFMFFGNGAGGCAGPYPEYMVLRGNYFHGPARSSLQSGVPSVQGAIAGTNLQQLAIVGNYADNLYYADGIPQGIYLTDCGNSGSCTAGGPTLIDNNYIMGMAMDIYVEVNNHAEANPNDFTVTHNYLYWPYSTTYPYAAAIGTYGCRNQIEHKGMLREIISGNYINGQWACANSGNAILTFNAVDVAIRSNYVTNSASGFGLNGTGNSAAQVGSYISSANRISVSNNVLYSLGRGRYQAGGPGVGAPAFEMATSPSNVTITNNTIGPIDNDASGVPGYYYPFVLFNGGAGQLVGLTMRNNILPLGVGNAPFGGGIGVQNSLCANGVGGTCSHPATPAPTTSVSPVAFSSWLGTIAGYADGASGLGMTDTSTIAGGNGYSFGNLSFTNCSSSPTATYNVNFGAVQYSDFTAFGVCPATSMTATASGGTGASLRAHYGLTPSYLWGGNVNVCTSSGGADMDQATCTSVSATMPSGDTWAPGADTAARLAAAGVAANYSITPTTANSGQAGANLNAILSATGTVTNISMQLAATSVQVNFTAPDSRACSFDVSPDGATWTRTTDNGGVPQRSLSVTGLAAGSTYQYRVLCYAEQLSPLFTGSQITDGSFTTLTAVTRNPSFTFSLAAFTGSTSFAVTMTAPDGVTQYTGSCTTSPCVVRSVPIGDYSTVEQWLADSTGVARSDTQVVNIR